MTAMRLVGVSLIFSCVAGSGSGVREDVEDDCRNLCRGASPVTLKPWSMSRVTDMIAHKGMTTGRFFSLTNFAPVDVHILVGDCSKSWSTVLVKMLKRKRLPRPVWASGQACVAAPLSCGDLRSTSGCRIFVPGTSCLLDLFPARRRRSCRLSLCCVLLCVLLFRICSRHCWLLSICLFRCSCRSWPFHTLPVVVAVCWFATTFERVGFGCWLFPFLFLCCAHSLSVAVGCSRRSLCLCCCRLPPRAPDVHRCWTAGAAACCLCCL